MQCTVIVGKKQVKLLLTQTLHALNVPSSHDQKETGKPEYTRAVWTQNPKPKCETAYLSPFLTLQATFFLSTNSQQKTHNFLDYSSLLAKYSVNILRPVLLRTN